MPDLGRALDELGRFAASPPSHHPDLSRVITRAKARRRRRRTVLGGVLAAVVAGAVLVAVDRGSDDSAHLRTVDDPPIEPNRTDDMPLPAGSLISGQFGIGQVNAQSLSLIYDQPTALAFNIGDGQIVAQAADADTGVNVYPPQATGPVLVLEGEGVREIAPQAGEEIRLHDAGVVDGRPTALVTARRGTTPDDTEEELLLVDVETGDRTSLGVVGGWESGLQQARFAGSHIATLVSGEAQTFLIVRSSLDGAVEWEAPDSTVDATVAMTVVDDHLVLLQPRFEGDDFEPRLGISSYDLETGAPVSTGTITLDPTSGLELISGFCFYAESASGTLICDQTSAAPIEIDLATGETGAVPGVDEGRVTLPRDQSAPTTTIPIAGEPCPGSVIRRVDGGDPEADALPPLTDASTDVVLTQGVLDQHRDEILDQYGASFVELGAGFGRAWAGVNGGRYATVDLDDYGIVVALRQPADCPVGTALYRMLDGVPLFFFIGEPADRPVISVSDQTISAAQRSAIDAFIRFAQNSNEATAAAVPFADVLMIGLGAELLRDLDAAVWANPRTWTLQLEGRWGMDGPAAALDFLESNPALTLTRDRTVSCSSDPASAAPAAMATFTRLTLTPADIDSCLDWFAVDLFLDEGGTIAGVTVELREP